MYISAKQYHSMNSQQGGLNLLDFGIIGEQLSISELLHSSYLRGRNDLIKEIENDFQTNLQSAAQSSSLLKSKLKEKNIEVVGMFLKISDFKAFKCLVILNSDDYYNDDKRRNAYKLSRHINDTNSRIELQFSLMSNSEEMDESNIISDGYSFKYVFEEI